MGTETAWFVVVSISEDGIGLTGHAGFRVSGEEVAQEVVKELNAHFDLGHQLGRTARGMYEVLTRLAFTTLPRDTDGRVRMVAHVRAGEGA